MSSYWERKSFWENIDFGIIGSGIVGLFAALRLKEIFPDSRVAIFERGIIPTGASTRNAGFACIGSISELLDDLEKVSEEEILNLVKQRVAGLLKLRTTLNDSKIDYENTGNFELFRKEDRDLYEKCLQALPDLNLKLTSITGLEETFTILQSHEFAALPGLEFGIKNNFEGLLNTGKMMYELLQQSNKSGVEIYNGVHIDRWEEEKEIVKIWTTENIEISVGKLLICTNAFTKIPELQSEIHPFRNQVYIYKVDSHNIPLGGYHFDRGYVYFRTISKDEILIGGGRNFDMETEKTTKFGNTSNIENYLKNLLENILGKNLDQATMHWSGILASGPTKLPIVKKLSNRTAIGVRLGGMGVAIGSLIGTEAANLLAEDDHFDKL